MRERSMCKTLVLIALIVGAEALAAIPLVKYSSIRIHNADRLTDLLTVSADPDVHLRGVKRNEANVLSLDWVPCNFDRSHGEISKQDLVGLLEALRPGVENPEIRGIPTTESFTFTGFFACRFIASDKGKERHFVIIGKCVGGKEYMTAVDSDEAIRLAHWGYSNTGRNFWGVPEFQMDMEFAPD